MKILFIIFVLPIIFIYSGYGKALAQPVPGHQDSSHPRGIVKMIEIQTPRGKFHVWTKRFGNNPKIKVLLLHGGPGGTHEIFESFEHFFPRKDIEFIEYDQLESYYSDKPNDSTLWNTKRFVEEVEQVRKALNLNHDNFYLLGHSWGGILAMEYALKYQQHLKGLIISNMMASVPECVKYNAVLRSQMRKSLLDSLTSYEDKGLYQDSTYQALMVSEFYRVHLCRLAEWPQPIMEMLAHINEKIYVYMQGPSEFKTGGILINWDRSGDLPLIKVPTLVVGARYDTQDPKYMKWMSTRVKNGAYLYCPEGSHSAMWDDQTHYFPGLISFITSVNKGTFKAVNK